MEIKVNKGEKVWQELLNPLSKDIAASEWLLLYTIYKNEDLCSKNIKEKMGML
jgi:hypothetical protein